MAGRRDPVLDDDGRAQAIASIQRYFAEQLEDEIGELKAGLLLDFVIAEIGGSVYNHAIRDAQAWFQERLQDLEGQCFRPEFGYWDR
ncbi:MAG: DUF2164 domain-containing protein [Myxococcota bacterium]|nr:DUF2164 domain-containing protein [Myxococcota bacterium]